MLAVDGNPIEVNNQSPLESLDDFSLMGIFDELNLVDLLKIASLNPRFKEIISDHYIVAKYGLDKSRIYITVASTVIVGYEDDKNSSPTFAFTYEQALSALENFGGSFINLRCYPTKWISICTTNSSPHQQILLHSIARAHILQRRYSGCCGYECFIWKCNKCHVAPHRFD